MIDYITLSNSNGSLIKRFDLLEFKPATGRSEAAETLSSGRKHVTRGRAQKVFDVTFLIPEISLDVNWGDQADLEEFHGYDMPGATPSDVLTLTLMDESVYQVRWLGDLEPVPEGTILYGSLAYYAVRAELLDVSLPQLDYSNVDYSMYLALI